MDEFASKLLLFNTPQAAREIAYTLRGTWDGCNGVVFKGPVQGEAVSNAIA